MVPFGQAHPPVTAEVPRVSAVEPVRFVPAQPAPAGTVRVRLLARAEAVEWWRGGARGPVDRYAAWVTGVTGMPGGALGLVSLAQGEEQLMLNGWLE